MPVAVVISLTTKILKSSISSLVLFSVLIVAATPVTAATLITFPLGCTSDTCSSAEDYSAASIVGDDGGGGEGDDYAADGGVVAPTDLVSGFSGIFYLDTEIADTNTSNGLLEDGFNELAPNTYVRCGGNLVFELLKQGVTLSPGNFLHEPPVCGQAGTGSFGGDGSLAALFSENITADGAFFETEASASEQQTVVPEPASLVLTGSGLLALLRARRRTRHAAN